LREDIEKLLIAEAATWRSPEPFGGCILGPVLLSHMPAPASGNRDQHQPRIPAASIADAHRGSTRRIHSEKV
jgi:hypothetical protein